MNSFHEPKGPRGNRTPIARKFAVGAVAALLSAAAIAWGGHKADWQPSVMVFDDDNSVLGGCPIESQDGLAIYTASTRPGSTGLDIWANVRADLDSPFGAAYRLPAPVNSDANDFCPSPFDDPYLLFISNRVGGCGVGSSGDIYLSRQLPWGGYSDPINLGCAEMGDGPNGPGNEFSPGIIRTWRGNYLYYSTDIGGDQDIYVSRMKRDGSFGPGHPVDGLNTASDDRMPTVSRNGLEIVFSSNRETWGGGMSSDNAGQDVYYSSRKSVWHSWSDPVNLSVTVPFATEAMDETRASFSGDGRRINYGAGGEIYVSERDRNVRSMGANKLCEALPLPYCD